MDGPRDNHTKWSKSDRKRQISYDIAYMWNLKRWYKWTYEIDPQIQKISLGLPKGKGGVAQIRSLGLAYKHWKGKLLSCVWLFATPWIPCPWNSSRQNTGVGNHSFLQGVFSTQESNWGLLHCRQILYQLSYQGSPAYTHYYIWKGCICTTESSCYTPETKITL